MYAVNLVVLYALKCLKECLPFLRVSSPFKQFSQQLQSVDKICPLPESR